MLPLLNLFVLFPFVTFINGVFHYVSNQLFVYIKAHFLLTNLYSVTIQVFIVCISFSVDFTVCNHCLQRIIFLSPF